MSHEVETMAYAGEVPWHGLGVPVRADLTPQQMLVEAGLDWTVDKVDLTYQFNGETKSSGKQALVRSSDGKELTTAGKGWNALQNQDAFAFFDDFVRAGDMEMHTAGSLKGGQIVWALAKIKEAFSLFGNDEVQQFLLFTNPHRFGSAIDVRNVMTRVVCWNTMSFAMTEQTDKMVRVHHNMKFDSDLVKETLGVAREKLDTYKEVAQFLGSKQFTDETLANYFKDVFPSTAKDDDGKEKTSRNAEAAQKVLIKQPGTEFAPGSWWQAFNATTYMTDHLLGHNNDTRLQSAWYGKNAGVKVKAMEKALEYANAA